MPKQQNYQEDISQFVRGDGIDRVVMPFIYESKVPTDFGDDLKRDFIEFNFYDLNSNALIETVTITGAENYEHNYVYRRITPSETDPNGTDSEELVVRTRQMIDDQVLRLSPGYYNVSVNFFSHEVGRVYRRPLRVVETSKSRKEIIVEYAQPFSDEERPLARNEIREFVVPSMRLDDLLALVKQIFQDTAEETTTDAEDLTSEDVITRYSEQYPSQYNRLFNSGPDRNEAMIAEDETAGFLKSANLNDKLPSVYYFLYDELIASYGRNDRRVQLDEMKVYIRNAIRRAFAESRSRFPKTVQVD